MEPEGWIEAPLGKLLKQVVKPVSVDPAETYHEIGVRSTHHHHHVAATGHRCALRGFDIAEHHDVAAGIVRGDLDLVLRQPGHEIFCSCICRKHAEEEA